MSTTDLTIHPTEDESETRRLFEIKQKFARYKPPDRLNPTIYRLFIQQKFSQCKQKIKEILDDTPEMLCEYPLLLRGQIAREEGEICESVEWISKALKHNPRSPKVLFEMGKSHYLLGEHQRAIELFKLALEAQQKRNEEKGRGLLDWRLFYWQSLAVYHVYKSPERVKKSQDVMLACPKINSSADMLMFLAKILDEQNETGAAVEAYKRSIEMEPENVDLIHSLGMLYLKMEDQSNAFTTFGKALSYDANYVPSVLAIASILQMNNDWDVALSKYKIVTADFDHSCAIWNNIGMCFFGKSKLIAALSCLHRANYLCPLDWKVLINMALVYYALRQFASAYHFAAAAYAVNSKNASILCVMSRMFLYKN
uniref:Bardet-Biedl syndrome 4 n=1 Tax=Meloidogyne javanica TaxID=6303 RepID=A0A915M6Y6_MELJA